LVRDDINVAAAFSQNLGGVWIHFVGDEYAWFGHVEFHFKYRHAELVSAS
jgi:hypothetical protein